MRIPAAALLASVLLECQPAAIHDDFAVDVFAAVTDDDMVKQAGRAGVCEVDAFPLGLGAGACTAVAVRIPPMSS